MWEDNRTAEERRRDLEDADRRASNGILALGFLKTCVKPLLVKAGADVGLVGTGSFGSAELLVEMDDVTYKLSVTVDHDG